MSKEIELTDEERDFIHYLSLRNPMTVVKKVFEQVWCSYDSFKGKPKSALSETLDSLCEKGLVVRFFSGNSNLVVSCRLHDEWKSIRANEKNQGGRGRIESYGFLDADRIFDVKPIMLFNSLITNIHGLISDFEICENNQLHHYLVEAMRTLADARDYIKQLESETENIDAFDGDEKVYAILNEIEPAIKAAIIKALQS